MTQVCFLQDSELSVGISANRLLVRKGGNVIDEHPLGSLERVAVFGNSQITTQAIKECLKSGIEVQYYTQYGNYLGSNHPCSFKDVNRRLRQYETVANAELRLKWSMALLQSKIRSQLLEYRRIADNKWQKRDQQFYHELLKYERRIQEASEINELMGIEGISSRLYFDYFGKSLPGGWQWSGRKYHPAPDPVNALLSLTYGMASGALERECHVHGLDPSLSFLHRTGYGSGGLTSDLLEPIRASLCDHFVLRLLHGCTISGKMFIEGDESCKLTPGGFKQYMKAYQGHLEPRLKTISEKIVNIFYKSLESNADIPDFTAIQPMR